MELKWTDRYAITVTVASKSAVISANREGLLSLANHLLALAGEDIGSHIHLDPYNALEDGSAELIIERVL